MTLARVSSYCAWGLLSVVFAFAYYQGADFASTKDSATVWGGVIGLTAFFAWLAVDEEEVDRDDEEDEDGADNIPPAEHVKQE